jgi:epoxyqueuosine reductase
LNYYTEEKQSDATAPKISKYAYGEDYHVVIKEKLRQLMQFIETEIGEVSGRVFVDSAPVMDKAWAKKSGLGWIGKNSNLIHPKSGSFFFIAELIIDLELEADGPIKDYCGTCTKCMDALLPTEFKGKMDNWAFGCDICQDVCPWNRFSLLHNEPRFNPSQNLLQLSKSDWQDLSEEVFSELFKLSAIKRTKFDGLKRNIAFLSK